MAPSASNLVGISFTDPPRPIRTWSMPCWLDSLPMRQAGWWSRGDALGGSVVAGIEPAHYPVASPSRLAAPRPTFALPSIPRPPPEAPDG